MKKILALVLLLAISLSFASCSALGSLGDITKAVSSLQGIAADIEKYEKMAEKLTNFKIVIETTDTYGNKETYTEMRCDEGHMFMSTNYIYFNDFKAKKTYTLDPSEKTGYVMNYEGDDTSTFGALTYGFLYFASAYKYIGAEKGGSEKIHNRKATYYAAKNDDETIKFWVDDEYGITVKYSRTTKSEDYDNPGKFKEYTETMEVTEFKVGKIKLSDMVNIKEYNITDFDNFSNGWGADD